MNLRLLPCEVLEGSRKTTARHQLLGSLQQVRAWLPFQHSVLELDPAKFPSFSENSKKPWFESPKHVRTRRDDWVLELYKSGFGPSTSSYIFTEGSQLSAGTRWGPCCFMWTHTFSCKTVLIYKALQFINSADENTGGGAGEGPEHRIIWVMCISNNILLLSCFKLCFSFGVLLATHLVEQVWFFLSQSIWVRHFWVFLLLLFFLMKGL